MPGAEGDGTTARGGASKHVPGAEGDGPTARGGANSFRPENPAIVGRAALEALIALLDPALPLLEERSQALLSSTRFGAASSAEVAQ